MSKRLARTCLAALVLVLGTSGFGRAAYAGEDHQDMQVRVSIDMKGATAVDVSAQLTALVGKPVTFVPADAEGLVSMQASGYPVGQLLSDLSKLGAVAVGGQPIGDKAAGAGKSPDLSQRVSLQAKGIDAAGLSRLLSGLLRTDIEFQPAGSAASFRVDLDVKGISLEELLSQVKPLGTLSPSNVSQ